VGIHASGSGLSPGTPTPLPMEEIGAPGARPYEIMPDGSFIALFPEPQSSSTKPQVDQLNITLNWPH
jgi:hypothetical protein